MVVFVYTQYQPRKDLTKTLAICSFYGRSLILQRSEAQSRTIRGREEMDRNTVHGDQELGDSTRSETTCKPSGSHRNCNCVRRTVAGTLAFILSGLLILLTTLFIYAGKKVNFVSYN